MNHVSYLAYTIAINVVNLNKAAANEWYKGANNLMKSAVCLRMHKSLHTHIPPIYYEANVFSLNSVYTTHQTKVDNIQKCSHDRLFLPSH